MSTRSYIFVESTEGVLDGVYYHCDGYLEGCRDLVKGSVQ